jgi:UDP-N-acetylmuramoyl-tripeptide--D-alanyl-D-alanine ligase
MTQFTAADLEIGTGGRLVKGSGDIVFSRVSIDTRSLRSGDLFFAIRGPNQDGHRFIPDALSKGAMGIVAEEKYEFPGVFPGNGALIKVQETHEALKRLATWTRNRWPGTLAAVTGSMGKTTTREFTAKIMESGFSVYQTPGNYNNLFGLPLALFGLGTQHEFGIFEMGMSAKGEIAEMCHIARPSVGIITNVAPVHLEYFNSLEEIARAKGELAEALPSNGTLIYNEDDPLVRDIAARFAGKKISFGFSDAADIRADHIEILGLNETRFRISHKREARQATIPAAGSHYVMNALAGAAMGIRFDIPLPRIVESISTLTQASMRGRIASFKEGFTVIDDCYNSNPRALIQMITVLAAIPSFQRRILVAGEMLELGGSTESLHYECGKYAAEQGIDLVIGIQGAAQEIVRAYREAGNPDQQAYFFSKTDDALDLIKKEIRKRDLMLVKGSRGVHVEKIVDHLRSHFTVQVE